MRRVEKETTKRKLSKLVKKVGPQKVVVNCPFSKKRIKLPAKFAECSHLDIFCGEAYTRAQVPIRTKILCPVCNIERKFDSLDVLLFYQEIVDSLEPDVTSITIHNDGKWAPNREISVPPPDQIFVKMEPSSQDDDTPLPNMIKPPPPPPQNPTPQKHTKRKPSTDKPNRSDADKARIKELEAKVKKLQKQFHDTSVKQSRALVLESQKNKKLSKELIEKQVEIQELNKQNLEVEQSKMLLSQELRHKKRELKETKKELTAANRTISNQDEAIKDVNTQEVEKGLALLEAARKILVKQPANGKKRKRSGDSPESSSKREYTEDGSKDDSVIMID